jgi:DNA polymerase-3 subunit delta'
MMEQTLPLSFSAILGQDKAKKFLERALGSGRIAHAYLFRGPDGVGKQLCARVVAARINCIQKQAEESCGRCPSCRKYLSANHPDITVISPEGGTIKIDRVRELCRSLSYPPYESTMRVVIIEDVHTMRPEAANSLLKTLEEPPENNQLILTAGASREVLPTIVSRCQTVPFYGLTIDQTRTIISRFRPDLEPGDALLLSRLAEGSPGQALLFEEQGLVEVWEKVVSAVQKKAADSAESISPILHLADSLPTLKENLIPLLGLLRIWVRDQMVDESADQLSLTPFHQARLAALDSAERQLARNCNRALVCEVLLFNLQSPAPGVFF